MAKYVYIDSEKGKLAIASHVFDILVEDVIHNIDGCSRSSKRLPASAKFRLKRGVRTSIHHGIVHISVFVDMKKEADIHDVTRRIEDRIHESLLVATETVSFDVQVRVESLI